MRDWWDELPHEEQTEIDEGLAHADAGETIPHEEFMKKFDKWRGDKVDSGFNNHPTGGTYGA